MCIAQGHNAVMPIRLKPGALRSRVKHSTTELQTKYRLIDQAKTNDVHNFQVLTLVTNPIWAETWIVSSICTGILSRAQLYLVA